MGEIDLRQAEPADYIPIISVINEWWGGRSMADMLPKLFFVHFKATSLIAEANGERVGFLIGFQSQTYPDEAYIHFVGVHPQFRKQGVGKRLYERFFIVARERGCQRVRCVTSPVNKTSIAFHLQMGFTVEPQDTVVDGIPVYEDYDGVGGSRVLFVKDISGGG